MDEHRSHPFLSLSLLLILLPSSPPSVTSSSTTSLSLPPPPECHEDERSALLEFKESFKYPVDSFDHDAGPRKLDSWKLDGGKGSCCSWDGVECDAESGHVIGLDICCDGLYSSINSSSALFRLGHLWKPDLSLTNFSLYQIPSAIGSLPRLTSLILSLCSLTGPIPREILGLTNLTSLDLSYNDGVESLEPSLSDLSLSLSKLEQLDLSQVNISSPIPHALTNLSSLTSLTIQGCGLLGGLPESILSLPNLQILEMSKNSFSGNLPEFQCGSRLKSLKLIDNDFSGEPPASIGNMTQLTELDLSFNRFLGPISSFAKVTWLTSLDLSYNGLNGDLPSSLESLTRLTRLLFPSNQLIGQIPSQLFNLTLLVYLDLSANMLSGTEHLDRI